MRGGLRALSVEVTSKGFSFAVLEGTERLVDWGGHEVRGEIPAFLAKLGKVIDRYRPDVVVLEEPAGSRRGEKVRERLVWVEQYACDIGLSCRSVGRGVLLSYAPGAERRKHELAVTVARQFPELAGRLPRPRKPWQSEARAMATFVAVARACVALNGSDHAR
jgi:hypothetical protein